MPLRSVDHGLGHGSRQPPSSCRGPNRYRTAQVLHCRSTLRGFLQALLRWALQELLSSCRCKPSASLAWIYTSRMPMCSASYVRLRLPPELDSASLLDSADFLSCQAPGKSKWMKPQNMLAKKLSSPRISWVCMPRPRARITSTCRNCSQHSSSRASCKGRLQLHNLASTEDPHL